MAAAPEPGSPRSVSDLDFADVFGGPPRRASAHDHLRRGRSRADSLDSACFSQRARPSSGPGGERPVFGEHTSSDNRRKQFGEEFYSDIFPGNESSCSSPRRAADVFGPASPGPTRVLSSGRPRISFSMKFSRGMDSSTATSPSHQAFHKNEDRTTYSLPSSPNSSVNSSLGRAVPPLQDEMRNPFPLHRYPSLSRLRSHGGDKKEAAKFRLMESECQGTPTSLESYINSKKFHFSFYKWAGKGAMLMLPATREEGGGKPIGLSGFPQVVVQGIDLIDDEDDMSTTGEPKSRADYEDCKSAKDAFLERKHSLKSKEGTLLTVFDYFMQRDEAEEPGVKSDTGHAKNPNVATVSPKNRNSRSSSDDKSRGRSVKGKVKDFIKIFSPEGSPKHKGTSETQGQRSSGKGRSKDGVQDKVSIINSEANEDVKIDRMGNESAFWASSSSKSKVQEKTETPALNMDTGGQTSRATFSERKEPANPSTESTENVLKDKGASEVDGGANRAEDLDGCMVEQLSEDQYSVSHKDQGKDQIKISESKIREWSKGKKGNIRALLSTLQYVLWPESGWKPVPLVDIIEGAAVKRAYQKALLWLHPDKLQQRGVATHQKYIAEKVFGILQEAWTEFNSVTFG